MGCKKVMVIDGTVTFEMLIDPMLPFLRQIGEDLASGSEAMSLGEMQQAVGMLARQVVDARVSEDDESGSFAEIAGVCSVLAAQALWTSFMAMLSAKALKDAQDGSAQTASVH
ncbi:MAG: hypothetical protein ABF968_07235 [Acetobacter sp.]|uniref:hypothetical protein n=1 Tax=Acetobacter sp. TaxID=440 RepID=UPI0039EB8393